ncbi:MAG: hypothetical protein IKV22_05970 [Paludibacteraceae bacterium]|nr:hypothetical protein [Paludibacteraceae bacterium]
MKLKTYLPLIAITVCLVVVLCIGTSWIATPAARYSATIGSTTPAQLSSSVVPAATFQSVTPDYQANHKAVRPQHSASATPTTSGSVFSSTTFHQPQVTSFGGGASTSAGSSAQLAHAATSNTAPAAVSVSLPTPKRNSQAATTRTSDTQAAAQTNSGTSTYTAHALPMRSSSKSASADASVAPMATTTYDEGYSINGGANKISGRRNAEGGDNPFGDGGLPSNPKEPGVPMGDMPWALMLILAAGYAVFRTRSIDQLDQLD